MKTYRSILSMGFCLLVLLSSSSFMIGFHLCGGDVQNVTLFSKATACPMEKQLPPCHRQEKSCCDDEIVIHEAQDFKNSITEFSFHPELISEVASPILVSQIISETAGQNNFTHYHPPLRATDLTVSHQVFRI